MVERHLGGGLRLGPLQPHLPDEHDQPPRARETVVRLEDLELGEERLDLADDRPADRLGVDRVAELHPPGILAVTSSTRSDSSRASSIAA